MPADLVPHAAIPELAAKVTPAMLEVLAYLQKADFILNRRELPPEAAQALDQLAVLGLVDAGFEVQGATHGDKPYLWTRNANGSRVLGYRTGIRSGPHYQIASADVAAWLVEQGGERWWNVDGDPLLTGRMTFPCPASLLAKELSTINRPLIVQARNEDAEAKGQPVGKEKLDQVVVFFTRKRQQGSYGLLPTSPADRRLHLCWSDSLFEWTLSEDSRVTQWMQVAEVGRGLETAQVKKE
jgi:hypothetical protein